MQKTFSLSVAGMSCGSCAARVRTALEAVEGVVSAEVTVRPGSAAVVATDAVDTNQLIAAVEAAGYRAEPGALSGLPVLEATNSCCARKD